MTMTSDPSPTFSFSTAKTTLLLPDVLAEGHYLMIPVDQEAISTPSITAKASDVGQVNVQHTLKSKQRTLHV